MRSTDKIPVYNRLKSPARSRSGFDRQQSQNQVVFLARFEVPGAAKGGHQPELPGSYRIRAYLDQLLMVIQTSLASQ